MFLLTCDKNIIHSFIRLTRLPQSVEDVLSWYDLKNYRLKRHATS